MFLLPKTGVVIADSHLHLALYQQHLQQHGPSTGFSVRTLSSLADAPIERLAFMKQIHQQLQQLSQTNPYRICIDDPLFLQACLSFLIWAKREKLKKVPEHEMAELICLLLALDIPDAKLVVEPQNLYLYPSPIDPKYLYTLKLWLEMGAQFLKPAPHQLSYLSVSSSKAQAAYVASHIVEPDKTCIALQDMNDASTLRFWLDLYQLPYTFLSEIEPSPIATILSLWCTYQLEPNEENLLHLIHLFNPEASRLFEQFGFHANLPDHQENPLYRKEEWANLKSAYLEAQNWFKDFQYAQLEQLLEMIKRHFTPKLELVQELNRCLEAVVELNGLNSELDIRLFKASLEKNKTKTINNIQGILIGGEEVLGLREYSYWLGLHAQTFPCFQLETGVFDERILEKLSLTSQLERLNFQQDLLRLRLAGSGQLTVLTPKLDVFGNPLEEGSQQKQIFGQAQFIPIYTGGTKQKNQYDIDQLKLKLSQSVSQFEQFARCPFAFFARYLLHLPEDKNLDSPLLLGTLLHERLDHQFKKTKALTLSWLKKALPKQAWSLTQLERRIDLQMEKVNERLDDFRKTFLMPQTYSEYGFEADFGDFHFRGKVDRIDESDTSFTVFDYKSGSKTMSETSFQEGSSLQLAVYTCILAEQLNKLPAAMYYFPLSASPKSFERIKLNRRKKNGSPEKWETFEKPSGFAQDFKVDGWEFNVEAYQAETTHFKSKRQHSFETMKEDLNLILNGLYQEMNQAHFEPVHLAGACEHCPYQSLCLSNRREKTNGQSDPSPTKSN